MLSGQSTIDDVAYGGGKPLSYDTIIRERVPEILNIAQVGLVGPYYYMSYVEIAQHFKKHVAPEDSGIAGAVVVCGTNNLDELVSRSGHHYIDRRAELRGQCTRHSR
jgi:hypothetical protein